MLWRSVRPTVLGAYLAVGLIVTVDLVTPAPLTVAFTFLALPSTFLAALVSLTLSVFEAPAARLKEALPISTFLALALPTLSLATSFRLPLQGPCPLQESLSTA